MYPIGPAFVQKRTYAPGFSGLIQGDIFFSFGRLTMQLHSSDCVVLSASEYARIKSVTCPGGVAPSPDADKVCLVDLAGTLPSRTQKRQLHQKSIERMKGWSDSVVALRERQERKKKEKEEKAEVWVVLYRGSASLLYL